MSEKSILLIDRDPSVRRILQLCLKELGGWRVMSAPSLHRGLTTLQDEKPDAILLDTTAHKPDIIDFVQRLGCNPLTQSVPILLISIKGSWFTPQDLQDLGVAGVLDKPFDPVLLPQTISQLLGWNSDSHSL